MIPKIIKKTCFFINGENLEFDDPYSTLEGFTSKKSMKNQSKNNAENDMLKMIARSSKMDAKWL